MTWAHHEKHLSGDAMDLPMQDAESAPVIDSEHADYQPEEESDIEGQVDQDHDKRTISEKRRAQNEIMRSYAANLAVRSTQREIEEAVATSSKQDQLSIRDILATQSAQTRITNPRDYQMELFERAKAENTVAVLDTGTGKTHIATLLLRHTLDQELEHRAKGGVHRMAFFLVDSVNLVFQQANVLRCGLDYGVEGICGAMGPSLWNKATWDKCFANNMVIVCTAAVLLECMMHSFVSMARINLLVFDEAHHAKNNHPYALVMKDYYAQEKDISKRPRIFGMTASPVDVRGHSRHHVQDTARELEKLLHAKIATATEAMLASNNISKPDEEVVFYDRLPNKFETPLHHELRTRYGNVEPFRKFFEDSKIHAVELGRWASDMYWSFVFTDEQSRKLQIREEFKFNRTLQDGKVEKLDEQMKVLKDAAAFIQGKNFAPPTLSSQDISSKVLQLHHWLNLYYARSDDALCIVFVEKRQTARLLKLLFNHIGGPNLRCDVLVGVNSVAGECNVSLRSQVLTLQKFRRGELNCLFSTSVAEEGLDIPQCNLVVRFDLYRTMIGYIQSRGRARHRNSKYLHMLERDNYEHMEQVMDVRRDETVMREFCNNLAHARAQDEANEDNLIDDLENKLFPSYTEPESGAKLTYRSSLAVLNHFVSVWPGPNHHSMWQPTYVVSHGFSTDIFSQSRSGFVCEVVLPEHLPIISCVGDVHSRKVIARCSAAYNMCIELRKKGYLNENLLPTMQKHLPAQRNALLAVSEKKKGKYSMLIKPEIWKQARGTIPDHLYLTVVDAESGLDRKHQPLGLLTRFPLPDLPAFPIYRADGSPSNIVSRPFNEPFVVNKELLGTLTKFTLQIYADIFNKEFEYDAEKMSYWLVPVLSESRTVACKSDVIELLDMEQITKVAGNALWKWTPETQVLDLLDRYLVDPFNGGRRYYTNRLAPEFKPHDPVPAYIKQGKKDRTSILEYTNNMWVRSRRMATWSSDQPVLEVDNIPNRRNLLASIEDGEKKELENAKVYICPEPLRISNLTTTFVAMCYTLPAIIHRFESYLIALDACETLGLNLGPALALEALTKDSENSDEHEEEKINFKRGMGPNYERLEFLGDCFLKMATSISVFVQQPDENEFEFHVRRMVMLCNQNLMETAVGKKKVSMPDGREKDIQLYKYVRSQAFSRRTWYPDGLKLLRGKGFNKSESDWLNLNHNLGDKSIADVCEAFIGASFMQYNTPGHWVHSNWDEAVKAVTLFANSADHAMLKWSDYYAAYVKPKYQVADPTAAMLDLAKKVEDTHPYHFRYPRLLRSAFVHPSQPFMWEQIPNYQRLEFLGDSLLDMAFIMHLFYKYPGKDPHWLTEHKTPMVSNKFLAAVCVKLGWYSHVKQNNSVLSNQIRDYVYEVEEAQREADGAVDYWVSVSEPPKCLADVIEAYVAAMFVDSQFDFTVVQQFFDTHLKPFFVDMTLETYENFSGGHPTTRLSRLLSTNFGCRDFRMGALGLDTIIPGKGKALAAMFMIHNKVYFHSMGTSGRYARERVSRDALHKLEGLPPYEFRKRYGCDCVDEMEVGGNTSEMTLVEKELMAKEAMGLNI